MYLRWCHICRLWQHEPELLKQALEGEPLLPKVVIDSWIANMTLLVQQVVKHTEGHWGGGHHSTGSSSRTRQHGGGEGGSHSQHASHGGGGDKHNGGDGNHGGGSANPDGGGHSGDSKRTLYVYHTSAMPELEDGVACRDVDGTQICATGFTTQVQLGHR